MSIQRFIIILTSFLMVVSCDSESAKYQVNPSPAYFGTVNLSEYTDIEIKVTNKTKGNLMLVGIEILNNYDFSIISGGTSPIEIAGDQTHIVKIRFAPTAVGVQKARLNIKHNLAPEPINVDLNGIGAAVAKIDLPVRQYDFNKVIISTSVTNDFEITNIGSADLVLDNFTFSGAGAALYSITSGGSSPVNVQPGSKHKFTVQFAPISIANYPAILEIDHNAINKGSPIDIIFYGEGVKFDPQITLSKGSAWDFGNVVSTNPISEICEITNTGVDPLTLNSASMALGTDFKIVSLEDENNNVVSFPHVVPVGLKAYLTVKFAPTVTALLNDTLIIDHNGTNEPKPLNIIVQGQGTLIIEQTFNYTGAVQQWIVPSGVTSIDVEIYGAEGGQSTANSGTPGKGGRVTARLTVQPGDTLNIYVGGKGGNGSAGVGGTGGWNGGANGEGWSGSRGGGGGGGASDIRKNGANLTDRIIVAGSGGGGGHNTSAGEVGGDGGGLSGKKGDNNYGGGGGSQTAGGAGGDAGSGRVAQSGSLGIGGSAWTGSTGGGGGAGYYGGGGGSFEAGGGGSSYTETTATSVVHTQGFRSGDGYIKISY